MVASGLSAGSAQPCQSSSLPLRARKAPRSGLSASRNAATRFVSRCQFAAMSCRRYVQFDAANTKYLKTGVPIPQGGFGTPDEATVRGLEPLTQVSQLPGS